MGIRDAENDYLWETAVTVTAISNVIDHGKAVDISRGQPKRYDLRVTTAFTAAGAATFLPSYVEADSADLQTNPTVLWAPAAAIGKATLVAGYVIQDAPLPRISKRYSGWSWVVATGPMTAGKLSGGIISDSETPLADRPADYNTGL
jgi:hypothetical protein